MIAADMEVLLFPRRTVVRPTGAVEDGEPAVRTAGSPLASTGSPTGWGSHRWPGAPAASGRGARTGWRSRQQQGAAEPLEIPFELGQGGQHLDLPAGALGERAGRRRHCRLVRDTC